MTTVRNNHNGPMDVMTKSGTQVIPALGTLAADFDQDYLDLLSVSGVVTVEKDSEPEPEKPKAKRKKGRG